MRYTNLVLFFESVNLWIFLKIINGKSQTAKPVNYVLFILTAYLGIIANYSFFWLILVQAVSLLVLLVTGNGKNGKKILIPLLLSMPVPFLLFLPHLPKFLGSLRYAVNLVNSWITTPGLYSLFETIAAYQVSYPSKYGIDAPAFAWLDPLNLIFKSAFISASVYYSSVFLLFLLLLFGLITALTLKRKLFIISTLILVPITVSFLVSQKYPIFIDYNLLPVFIGIVLLISWLIEKPGLKIPVLILFIGLNSLSLGVLLKFETRKEDWSNIYAYLGSFRENKILLLLNPPFNESVFNYYDLKSGRKNNFKLITFADDSFDLSILTSGLPASYTNICLLHNPADNFPGLKKRIFKIYNGNFFQTSFKSGIVECYKKPNA